MTTESAQINTDARLKSSFQLSELQDDGSAVYADATPDPKWNSTPTFDLKRISFKGRAVLPILLKIK